MNFTRFFTQLGYFAALVVASAQAQTGSAPAPVPEPSVSKTSYYQSIEYADIDLEKSLPPKVIVLLDASGSMGQLMDKQKSKMFYAKKLFGSYLADQWREKAEVGLLVYGGRRKKDCSDFLWQCRLARRVCLRSITPLRAWLRPG